ARARQPEVLVILLSAAEPLELDRRHRIAHAEPTPGIEPDQVIRVGRIAGGVGARERRAPLDHPGLSQKREPRPDADVALVAARAGERPGSAPRRRTFPATAPRPRGRASEAPARWASG